MATTVPEKGFIFWPVGNGDSTTVRVDESVYLQIDLRHMEQSENDDDPAWPIIDELVELLPKAQGKPYLSAFALTHPDKDHCQGFAEFRKRVFISEIWMSPRTFREYHTDEGLCDDAEAFHTEAMRRVRSTIAAGGDPGSGDRVRIIGYDYLLEEDAFRGFPKEFFSVPGHYITTVDGIDFGGQFHAFVHAPFLSDSYGDRNDCSLAFQIALANNGGVGRGLLMGDLKYPIIRRIFNANENETLEWNVLLAPHHCSKSVMYWQDEGEDQERLREDILRDMGNRALVPGYVVSSSAPIPATNKAGDNPPHAKAKAQYQRIVPNEFLCTQDHPNEKAPVPITFEVNADGLVYLGHQSTTQPLAGALKAAGAGGSAPAIAVGFGSSANPTSATRPSILRILWHRERQVSD